ncbi:MAG TPA: tyrosine-protein phosphatase [Polyangiales bacterium]|nr:tyrosine-protein phosphatase [Polyangiales bacterium]
MRPLRCASLCAVALSAAGCLQSQEELIPHRARSKPASVAPGGSAGHAVVPAGAGGSVAQPPSAVQELFADDLLNARDLGGTPLSHDRSVRYGQLQRGPVLARLSDAGCAEFEKLGVRSVLDLREETERSATPESACVEAKAQLVHAPLPIPYSLSAIDYLADLNTDASIARAFELLGDPEAYPIYFHCTYGRDRTGVLAALILLALGASPDVILEEYSLSSASVGATPNSLRAVLDEVERRGGIEAHLGAIGVSAQALEVLRARVVVARAAE